MGQGQWVRSLRWDSWYGYVQANGFVPAVGIGVLRIGVQQAGDDSGYTEWGYCDAALLALRGIPLPPADLLGQMSLL